MSGFINSLKNIYSLFNYLLLGSKNNVDRAPAVTPFTSDHLESTDIQLLLKCISEKNIDKFKAMLSIEFIQYTSSLNDSLMHWAVLGSDIRFLEAIMQFLCESSNPDLENQTDLWSLNVNKRNNLLQTPLHWACTMHNLAIVQFLVINEADINARDSRGVTPFINCAQYGNLSGAIYLYLRGAIIDLKDAEGDTALHWALFKGYSELSRFLLEINLDPHSTDNFGQSALHFACLSGHMKCVQDLVEHENVKVNVRDKNNKTPLMIAAGRGHYNVVRYLEYVTKQKAGIQSRCENWKNQFTNQHKNSRIPFYFFLLLALVYGNGFYVLFIRPATLLESPITNVVFLLSQLLMWVFYILLITKKQSLVTTYDGMNVRQFLQNVNSNERAANKNCRDDSHVLSRVCWSCRSFKSPRSRHCNKCNQCFIEMDHHCPYALGCVAQHNRVYFLLFLIMLTVTLLCALMLMKTMYFIGEIERWSFTVALIFSFIGISSALIMLAVLLKSGFQNLTVLEEKSWRSISYLQDSNGNFYNPYNKGFIRNFMHFLNLNAHIPEYSH